MFAEGHGAVAAERIAARIRGETSSAQYGGRGICYLEFGGGQVATVDVTFFGDQRRGSMSGPSETLAADKAHFGATRIKRWYDRDWSPLAPSASNRSDARAVAELAREQPLERLGHLLKRLRRALGADQQDRPLD